MKSQEQVQERLSDLQREYNVKAANDNFRPFEAGKLNTEIVLLEWVLTEK